MTNSSHRYRVMLKKLSLAIGGAALILVIGAPSSPIAAPTKHNSTSTRPAISAAVALASRSTVTAASPAPTPTPTTNPTVTNPGPLPPGAPRAGVAPSNGASRLQRALAAAGTVTPASSLSTVECTSGACDLYAETGVLTFPASPAALVLPVWGFSTTRVAGSGQVPGPVLSVNAGDHIRITIHNDLPKSAAGINQLSIEMPASAVRPDLVGIAPGSLTTYDFGSLAPGTYLYEAGPTPYGARQVKMGLAGILVVRPSNFSACNCAYGNTADMFVDEAPLLLNEFDPAFNFDPFESDPIDFSPSEFAINGVAYDPSNPTAGKIDVAAGDVLLVRYANLSDHERGITIANERQNILANDSYQLTNPADVATNWLNPGQVSDSFVTIDPGFPLGTHVPVYDAGFHFSNGPSLGLGGMFTYLDVTQSLAGSASGPVATAIVSPATNSGIEDLTVTGTITPSATGALTDAEWFLDDPGIPGAGQHIFSNVVGSNYQFVIPSATLNAMLLSSVNRDGDHIIWVHGQDSSGSGTWGVVSGDVFTYNAAGPVIGGLSGHVSPTNGLRPTDVANGGGLGDPLFNIPQNAPSNDLVILGMAGASLSNFVVTAAEYCIDPVVTVDPTTKVPTVIPCVAPVPMVLTPGGTNGTPPHQIDAAGNPLVTPTACVPVPSPPGVTPPSFGAAPGGGSVVSLCGTVPAAMLRTTLAEGVHTLYIHACEQISTSAGGCGTQPTPRWADFNNDAAIQFVVDRTGPDPSAMSMDPNPNNGHRYSSSNLNFLATVQVAVTLTDPVVNAINSNIAYAEVFVTAPGTDPICSPVAQPVTCASASGPIDPVTHAAPPNGSGAEMIPSGGTWDTPVKLAFAYIPLAELTAHPEGYVRFWVHAQDRAGNFGTWAYADMTFDKTPPVFDTPALPVPPAPPTTVACTGAAGCSIPFTAHDPSSGGVSSNIVQAEWFIDNGATLICEINVAGCTPEVSVLSDPGFGNATPIDISTPLSTSVSASITLPTEPVGTHIVFRVRDAAGNWSLDNLVVTS